MGLVFEASKDSETDSVYINTGTHRIFVNFFPQGELAAHLPRKPVHKKDKKITLEELPVMAEAPPQPVADSVNECALVC